MIPLRIKTMQEEDEGPWSMKDGILLYNRRLVVPAALVEGVPLRTSLIKEVHEQLSTAHPGEKKTASLIKARFYWKGLTNDVEQYIRNCYVCKRSYMPRDKAPGLLQPLPVPHRPWQHISMDFKSFPVDRNSYNAILVFVDRLGKRLISVPYKDTCTAKQMAQLFIDRVWRYYRPPNTIVSDQGP